MPAFDPNARFFWLGKANTFTKGTDPWQRIETARKLSGKTVGELIARTQASTPATLVGRRLIAIDGYNGRATKEEMEARRDEPHAIVEEQEPMMVRQVFYQATVRGIVEKEESGYDKVLATSTSSSMRLSRANCAVWWSAP